MPSDNLQEEWDNLSEQDQVSLETMSLPLWCRNRITRVDNRKFSIEDFPHLEQIYQDKSRKIVSEKSAQQGLTIYGISESFHSTWATENRLYFFPTSKLVSKFVQGRYDLLIQNNPRLSELIKSTDNTTIKQIGQNVIYFSGLGAATKEGGQFDVISVPVDGITFDEVDLMHPIKIKMALERMEASPVKKIRMFSTPTIPNYGINAEFILSDQKYWNLKCEHCNKWNVVDDVDEKGQPLGFPECIEQGYLACKKCGKQLDPANAEWVAKHPDMKSDASGYHVSRLYSKFADCKKILKDFKECASTSEKAVFFNNTLGIPYLDETQRLNFQEILKLCGSHAMLSSSVGTYMGIDVGDLKGIHITIIRPSKTKLFELVYAEIYKMVDPNDPMAIEVLKAYIKNLVNKYGVRKFGIDAMPQTMVSRAIVNSCGGKGWMVRYEDGQKGFYEWKEDIKEVRVNRTESLDRTMFILKNKHIELFKRNELVEEMARHYCNIVKTLEEDPDTGKKEYYYKKIGPEDHMHSLNYALVCGYNGQQAFNLKSTFKTAPEKIRELMNQ